jgi:hypothetical protein
VSYRRIATIIAVLAASVALVPTLAFAGDAPHPAARGADLSGSPLTAAKSAGFKTFTNKSAAAAGTGNVTLDATAENAYSFLLEGGQSTPAAPESTATIDWGDGTTSNEVLNDGPLPIITSHTYAELGTYTITVTVTDDGANTETGTVTVTTAGSDYTAYGPIRVLDTRYGTGAAKAPVKSRSVTQVKFAGNGGIPADVTAVVLNVTVTDPTAAGFITVYGDGSPRPATSNVNFSTNQTIANSAITPVGSDGEIRIYNGSSKATSVVVDVVGYYSAASEGAYVPITPTRLLDTRQPSPGAVSGPLPEGDYTYLAPFVPAEPAVTSFVLNATVTETTGNGDLTVSPDPNTLAAYDSKTAVWPTKPSASTLNWTKGETVANLAQANAAANGIIDFWNSGSGDIALIVDAFGYYAIP